MCGCACNCTGFRFLFLSALRRRCSSQTVQHVALLDPRPTPSLPTPLWLVGCDSSSLGCTLSLTMSPRTRPFVAMVPASKHKKPDVICWRRVVMEKVWSRTYIKCQVCELSDEFQPRRHASHHHFVPCCTFFFFLPFVPLFISQKSRQHSSLSGSQMNEAGRE